MCLYKIRPDMNRFEKGWKVFSCTWRELHSLFQGRRGKPLPENKWIHYKAWSFLGGQKLLSDYDGLYPQGWHVEATRKGAEGWRKNTGGVIRKVLCRDMHTAGRQNGSKVGVCRYIKILPEGSR